jgi:hypothetical protein
MFQLNTIPDQESCSAHLSPNITVSDVARQQKDLLVSNLLEKQNVCFNATDKVVEHVRASGRLNAIQIQREYGENAPRLSLISGWELQGTMDTGQLRLRRAHGYNGAGNRDEGAMCSRHYNLKRLGVRARDFARDRGGDWD